MRNITENFWNSTTGSNLYCVWVPVHADGGDRLVTIWIDRGLTAFQSQMQENPHDIDTTVQTHARHDEDRGDQYVAETLNFILPVRH